jgi:hypothetical protein
MKITPILAATVAAGLLLAGTPAEAEKPARGCPDSFVLSNLDDVERVILEADQDADPAKIEAFFSSYDKNGDGLLCTKGHPHVINPVDNTSNHEADMGESPEGAP